jgi:predicted nucleic acid-binding protein
MTERAYIDTSCVLKLLIMDESTPRLARLVARDHEIVVSVLTHLEARTRLLVLRRGGTLSFSQYRETLRNLDRYLQTDPFRMHTLAGGVFDVAIEQLRRKGAVHCRSLDRLHLAAMETLGAKRLITTDAQQARAARSLGLTIVAP